jgi:hypothetical protein
MTELSSFSIGLFPFRRRPVREAPPEGTIAFVDNGHAAGWSDRVVGMFKDGKWTNGAGSPLRFEPNYWTVLDDERLQRREG